MARQNSAQEGFNTGEVSGRLAARLGFNKYQFAGEVMLNTLPLIEGGMTRRPGSRYVAAIGDQTKVPRLLPFVFSTTQAYVVLAEENKFRFFKDQGQITAGDTDAVIANGTFPSGIASWTDRSSGAGSIAHDAVNLRLSLVPGGATSADIGWAEQAVSVGAAFDTNEHVLKFRVLGAPGDKIELRIGTASVGSQVVNDVEFQVGYHCYPFTPGDGNNTMYIQFRNRGDFRNKTVQIDDVSLIDNVGISIDTPYTEAQLFGISHAQSADVMYIVHSSHPVYKLTRSSHTGWSLIEVAWIDGPYLAENSSTTTLIPSAATGLGITLTLSSIAGVNAGQGWISTDIGRLVRYKKASAWGYAVITSITSTTIAVADVREDFEAAPTAVTTFHLGAWSGTTGYPTAITFFEQRLFLAGTSTQPQTFWGTQTATQEDMTPDDLAGTVEADDAMNFSLATQEVNVIRWLSSGVRLFIGTVGGEWVVRSAGPVLKPSDIDVKQHTTHGSAAIPHTRVGAVVLFVQEKGRKLRELVFDGVNETLLAPDMTILAPHILGTGAKDAAFQEEPGRLLWIVRKDGQIGTLSYERAENVVGWSRHIIGGTFATGIAIAETVATIPGNDGSGQTKSSAERDEVWFVVKRTINGATKRYIEFLEGQFEGPLRDDFASDAAWEKQLISDQADAYYVDSMLSLDSPVTISGATAADPVVITATAHGFTDEGKVNIEEVVGMTELNGNPYYVATGAANTFELLEIEDIPISGATTANPVVITSTAHGLSNGDMVGFRGVLGMVEISGNTYKVANKTADTFELNTAGDAAVDGSAFTAYTSGGTIHAAVDGTAFTAYVSGGKARAMVTSVTGLDHLEGETVSILADGAVHPNKTVASGAITLDYAAGRVQAGLPYTHRWKSLKNTAGTQMGTPIGQTKRYHLVTLVIKDGLNSKIGPDTDNLFSVPFREVADAMDTAVPLFTGEVVVDFDGDWETDPRIVIEGVAPVPVTYLAIAPRVTVNEL